VLDFYCAAARLAIEVDGAFHDRGDAPAWDAERDAWLRQFGVATLRIPASNLYADLDSVLVAIVVAATARLPLHHPAAPGGPPPQAELGED
jgi:very-short-patch-repair endonuclease